MTDVIGKALQRGKISHRTKKSKDCYNTIPPDVDVKVLIIADGVRNEHGETIDWIVRDVNEEVLREMGLPADGLLNKSVTGLVAAGSPLIPNIESFHVAMAQGCRFEFHSPNNGGHFLVSMISLGSQTLVTTAVEITELKQAEKLKKALNYLHSLLNSTLEFDEMMQRVLAEAVKAMGTDMATIALIDGERWVTRYGYGVPEDMIGKGFSTEEARGAENARRTKQPVIVHDAASDIRINPKKAKEFRFGSFIIYPLIRKKEIIGTINFINTNPGNFSNAQLDFVRMVVLPLSLAIEYNSSLTLMRHEITEHKRAENVWRESGKLLGAAIQQMPAGVIIAEAPSGKMILGNHQVERIWRQPFLESANIGEYSVIYKGFHEDGRIYDSREWPLARSVTKGELVVEEEISLLRGDGTKGTVLASSAPIKDDAGQIIAGVMTFHSITERKQLEKALWNAALEAEQRAKELDAVIASIPDGLIIHDKNGKIKSMNAFARDTLVSSDNGPECPLTEHTKVTRLGTQEALWVSEENYRRMIETANEGIIIGELDGRIRFVNPKMAEMLGYSQEELVGRVGLEFLDADQESAVFKARTELEERRRIQREFKFRRKDGTYLWTIANTSPLLDNQGYYLGNLAMHTDITERKRMEKDLQRNNEKLEIIAETAHLLLSNDKPDSIIQIIATRVMKYLHCDVFFNFIIDESQGRLRLNAYAGIPTEAARDIEWLDLGVAICGAVARDGCRIVLENIQENGDGRADLVRSFGIKAYACHPLHIGETTIGTLSFGALSRISFTDEELALMKTVADQVSIAKQRKKMENALQESELRYRTLFTSMNEGLALCQIICDETGVPFDYRFLDVNHAYEVQTGFEAAEVIGRTVREIFTDIDSSWIGIFGKVALTGEPVQFENYNHKKDKYYHILSFSPAKGRFSILFLDITERKRAEESLRKSQALLKSLTDSSPNLIFIKDQQSRIVMANPATLAVIGKPIKQVIGKDDSEHYDVPKIGLAIMENDRRIMESGQTEIIEETVWIAGKKRIFLSTKTPRRDAEGHVIGLLGISQDITERKEMEEKLKLLLKSYQQHASEIDAILEAIPHAVYFGNEDGVTRCNAEAISMLGASSLQDFQQRIGELGAKFRLRYQQDGGLVEPENLPFNRALKGEVASLDTWATKADSGEDILIRGNAVPIMIDGQIAGAVVINIDITDQYRSQQALRESEEKMRAIFEQAGVGINQVGLDGRYIKVNHKFQEMTGYTKEELLNHTIYDLHHPDDRKVNDEYILKLISGEILTYTDAMRLIRKDGRMIWVNLTASLVRSGSRPAYFIWIVEDFSERKQMEQELQAKQEELFAANEELQAQQEELTSANEELQAQQEELITINQELQAHTDLLNTTFQELQRQSVKIQECAEAETRARDIAERRAVELDATISSIAAGIIIYDDLGNIFRMNEFARSVMGYSDDGYPETHMDHGTGLNLCKSDGTSYAAEETPLYRALRGEIIRDEELMVARVSDQPIWLSGTIGPIRNNHQTVIGVIFVFTDITERKRKTEDLLASERELLKVTLNSLGEGVVAIDPDERIMLVNQAAANLTGYSENEVIGEPFHKIFYVLDDKTSEPFEVNASQKTSGNLILVTRDLREVPIAMNSSPIKALDERIIGRVTILQDISEKQKIDRELLKADKLESLGILAGGIAHDFNNILAAILSNIQLALRKLEKDEDIKKYLLNTVETTRKASDLTKQLLTFSRGGAPVKKDASLIELIRDTAEFVLRGSKTKAEFMISDGLWVASIDEGQISQVIHNLVLNAKQAMPKGGIIIISAENVTIGDDALELVRFNPGNYVKITVKDQGFGIAREHLSKIFDPYFTTKKEGNGLGLATSYSIISQHNGYLEVESQENTGTSFFIYLPASNTRMVPVESKNEIAASGAGLKILFMDDEEKILQAVGEMLNDCFSYRVVLATDGAEAIELYKQAQASGEPFDAVIMDLTVPGGMGGQEAVTYLRDIDPKVKAIVSSGYANDPIMADYERYGFCGVVSKPYKIGELNGVLYKVLSTSKYKE
jgi:PAS domain S-box-containing protein